MKNPTTNEFHLRSYQEETLSNGLKIIFIEDSSLPKVNLSLLIKAGTLHEPNGLEGLNLMTASLLDQGSSTRNSTQIAEEFGQIGTEIIQNGGRDFTSISTSGLSISKDKLLELFVDVVMNPSFEQKEIIRRKAETVASIKQIADNPSEYANIKSNEVLFGSHPYSRSTLGTETGVLKIKRTDIIRHYFKYYRPNNSFLSVTGQLTPEFNQKLKQAFSLWQYKEIDQPTRISPVEGEENQIFLVHKSGLQQAQLRWGQLGIQRNDPSYMKLRLANIILGGAFVSRLNQKVRDDLGLTYSIDSHFEALQDRGSFEISSFTRNDKVAEAIRVTQEVIEEFRKGVTSKELDAAKAYLIGQFPAAVETPERLAFNLMVLRYYGIPDTYLSDFLENVNSISLKEVNREIEHFFQLKKMKILIHADEKIIQDQLNLLSSYAIKKLQ